MTGGVAKIWRHPIKSHGREALETVALVAGQTMPWDRAWAVAHSQSKIDGTVWAPCVNFSRGAKTPSLMAISATLDDATGILTLTHPDRPILRFSPETQAAEFLAWVAPLMPADRAASARLVHVPDRGMTDTDFPSISLINLASNDELSQQIGTEMSPIRWRANIWLNGMEPWQEFELIGKTLQLGAAQLTVRERIVRCMATTANPETGHRDADTLGALRSGWGHQDFGIYAEVTKSGAINVDDVLEIMP
jgi:uncharacterized protein YcbX